MISSWELENCPLSENGQKQVEEIGQLLHAQDYFDPVELILHSPMIRAVDTMKGMVGAKVETIPVTQLACLVEISPKKKILSAGVC